MRHPHGAASVSFRCRNASFQGDAALSRQMLTRRQLFRADKYWESGADARLPNPCIARGGLLTFRPAMTVNHENECVTTLHLWTLTGALLACSAGLKAVMLTGKLCSEQSCHTCCFVMHSRLRAAQPEGAACLNWSCLGSGLRSQLKLALQLLRCGCCLFKGAASKGSAPSHPCGPLPYTLVCLRCMASLCLSKLRGGDRRHSPRGPPPCIVILICRCMAMIC